MDQKLVGKRIKCLRINKLGMSQEDFAKKIGVDRTYFCRLEAGKKNLTLDTLNKVCEGLEMSLKDFFNFEIPEKKESA